MKRRECIPCRQTLVDGMAEKGIEVVVSTEPPILLTAYAQGRWTCPHGTAFYMEPTTDQIAAWTRDGVA